MQQGLQNLQNNQLKEALLCFEKCNCLEECSKQLIKYSLVQDIKTREYILQWMLKQNISQNIRLDVLNILSCTIQNKQQQLQILNEALQFSKLNCLNPSATLINLTCIYSKLGDHQKALQYGHESLKYSNGKQQIVSYHNIGIEYQAIKQFQLANHYHQKAYQLSIQLFGQDDKLTQKMSKYVIKKEIQQNNILNKFRLRSQSRERNQSKTFYYKREASKGNIPNVSSQSFNQSFSDSKSINLKPPKNSFENNNFENQRMRSQTINVEFNSSNKDQQNKISSQQIRMQFLQQIHQENIQYLEKQILLTNKMNLSQESIQNILNPQNQSFEFCFSQENDNSIIKQKNIDLTIDEDVEIIQNSQKKQNQDCISFTNQDTFDNTLELQNKAANKIQQWYKKKNIQKQTYYINSKQQQKAAIIIQRNLRKTQLKQQQILRLNQNEQYTTIQQFQINNNILYFMVSCKIQNDNRIITCNEIINKKQNIKKNQRRYYLEFKEQELKTKFQQFDEFNQKIQMSQEINQIAYQLQKTITNQLLIKLLYINNDSLQLYGITDCLLQDKTQDQLDTTIQTIEQKCKSKLSLLLVLQKILKGYLARRKMQQIKDQQIKHKRFIQKISGNYYYVILKEQRLIMCYNIQLKKECKNQLVIPIHLMNFYGSITQQNCLEIIAIENETIIFTDDAQYLIYKQQLANNQINHMQLEQAAKKLQRVFRQKLKFINYTKIEKIHIQQAKIIEILFQQRRVYLYKNQYHITLTAKGIMIQGTQQLLIEGGVTIKEPYPPQIKSHSQRLFQPIPSHELQEVCKIILNEIQFSFKNNKFTLICNSIEEVYGYLLQRDCQTFKQCLANKQKTEPTQLGRNYLNKNILCRQYLKNTIDIVQQPINYFNQIDSNIYEITYIKRMYKDYEILKQNKRLKHIEIQNINHYVNDFPSIYEYEKIIDPEEIYQKQLENSAIIVQRCFKLLKFRLLIHKKCQERKRRKQALLEAQKNCQKPYYYEDIQKIQPFTTPQILERRGETSILLKNIEINCVMFEWLIVLPYYDIVITEYSTPKRFYQIKQYEYINNYVSLILKEPIEKIVQYFNQPIIQFHPSQKEEIIYLIKEQFSKKVIRAIRLKLFFKQLRDMPISHQFLIKTFITYNYSQINYFYRLLDQKLIIYLQNETIKRKYETDIFYLEILYNHFHQTTKQYLHKDQFLQLLTLTEQKSYHKYRKILIPLINILHSYLTINSEFEFSYSFLENIIPIQEIQLNCTRLTTQGYHLSTSPSLSRLIPTTVYLQNRWRQHRDKINYIQKMQKLKQFQIKMLCKQGQIIERTFIFAKQLNNNLPQNQIYICIIYQSEEQDQIKIRVELIPYKEKQLQRIWNIFYFFKEIVMIPNLLSNFILSNLKLEENQIILQEQFINNINFTQQQKQITEISGNTGRLIYHQRRQYNKNSFIFNAVHSGNAPMEFESQKNTIKINVDLTQFKTQYPMLNYNKTQALSQISQQIIDGIRINKKNIKTKSVIIPNVFDINGNCELQEELKSDQISDQYNQTNIILIRFSQVISGCRFTLQISQIEIPIQGYSELDSIIDQYHTMIKINAYNQQLKKRTSWKLTFQQAQDLTNKNNNLEIAQVIRNNILCLEDKFVYICDYSTFEFDNVIMIKRKTLIIIQRMMKNRKFKKLRKQFENDIRQIKQNIGNQTQNIIIYEGINQFHSDDYFICMGIQQKHYQLMAWNIKNYECHSLTLFKKKSFFQQLEQVKYIGRSLIL